MPQTKRVRNKGCNAITKQLKIFTCYLFVDTQRTTPVTVSATEIDRSINPLGWSSDISSQQRGLD